MKILAPIVGLLALPLVGCSNGSPKGAASGATETDASTTKAFTELFAYDWTIDPGVETYFCGYKTLTDDLFINDFRPVMPSGTHHVVLGFQDPAVPDGFVPVVEGMGAGPSVCTGFSFGDIMAFGAGVGTEELAMPEGVAVKIPAGKQLVFGLHLLNASTEPLSGHSGIQVVNPKPSSVVQEAEIVVAADLNLNVPPGKITQSGTCTMVADTTIFAVMPHMHRTGVHMTTTAGPADGGVVTLVDTDYAFTDQKYTTLDPLVPLSKGDKINVACTYENPGPDTLTFGESTTKNEMCLTLAYRYPAVTANLSNNSLGYPPGYCGDPPPVPGCGDVSADGLEVLASGLASPATLALDATSIYWLNNTASGSVMKIPLAGGTPATLASEQNGPWGIAVDATSAYWTDFPGGTVMKGPIAGGSPTTLASGQSGPNAIVVDATSVYWTNYNDGTIVKEPLTGGSPTTLYSGQGNPDTLAVDATSVYWTDTKDNTVMKGPIAGGTPTTLASGQDGPQGIVVDATSAYWVNHNDGSVMKVPLAGGTPTTLAAGKGQPLPDWSGIAVDATSVYWANGTDGTVMKMPLAGGTPKTLASGLQRPVGIAVDATSVYWTDACGKLVKLTPK